MDAEIIADKYALLKTRGSNGVAFTHIVEDTLLGQRIVVKVSDKLGLLTLEYLKTMNMAREMDIPGLLMPMEGGILEEEAGYYMAFPELGEPSLENYLRIGIPFTSAEAVGIIEQLLGILEDLHGAGLCHLFINTRNIFYRARGRVTLKDPALKADFFHPLLELVATPDFSYFSPGVMDGEVPGAEADLYAVGRLAERLLEEVVDADVSPRARALRWLAEECSDTGPAGEIHTAGNIRESLKDGKACIGEKTAHRVHGDMQGVDGQGDTTPVGSDVGEDGPKAIPARPEARHEGRKVWKRRRAPLLSLTRVLILVAVLVSLLVITLIMNGNAGREPAVNAAGGSVAGNEAASSKMEAVGKREGGGVLLTSDDEAKQEEAIQEEMHMPVQTRGERLEDNQLEAIPQMEANEPPARVSPAAPVAAFSLSPSQGRSPLQVHLDASSSYDPDGTIVSYGWSFGGSGQALFHVFESNVIPATVTVTLTVTDDGGNVSSTTRSVTLY